MPKHQWTLFALAAAGAIAASAQQADCNAPAPSPSVTIALPANPFVVAPTRDGCWLFVAMVDKGKGAVAVLQRDSGRVKLVRTVPLPSGATGMSLTHDGKLLVVAAGSSVDLLDTGRLISGSGEALLGSFSDGDRASSIYANVTADDKLLFVSDESKATITVVDLAKARANGFKDSAIIGRIPVGRAPIALTFSSDGKWLYTTSEVAADDWHWPAACKPEGRAADAPISNPEGAVIVVDVARAATDPAHAVMVRIPAGCSPVRMAMSPGGDRIYVTARNSNAVLTFDTAKLVSDPEHAKLGAVPVGPAPVPVAVIDGGRKVVAGNSNRFAGGNQPQNLTVMDAAKMQDGAAAVLGTIPAGAFPREMAVSTDGRTLFLSNFGSQSLQVIDIANLPVVPARQ
jgi:DNA-binding beta-propeller fold protein YncE